MYTKNQKSDGTTVFSIEYARLPLPIWSTLLVAFGTWILQYNMEMEGFSSFMTTITWALVGIPLLIWLNIKRGRMNRHVEVSPTGISVQGKHFTRSEIQYTRLMNKWLGSDIYYTNSNTANAGQAAGGLAREEFAKRSWRIEVEVNGKAHVIVDKMDDITSRGVYADMTRILRFGKEENN